MRYCKTDTAGEQQRILNLSGYGYSNSTNVHTPVSEKSIREMLGYKIFCSNYNKMSIEEISCPKGAVLRLILGDSIVFGE